MKRSLIAALFVTIVLMPVAAHASGITTGSMVKVKGWTGSSLGGGPFTIGKPSTSDADFLTFCIEINEFINVGSSYYVNIALEARGGGQGGGNPDPLDSKTAYLYSSFMNNSLTGYDGSKAVDRDGLQMAIWFIENEVSRGLDGKYYKFGTTKILGNSAIWQKADFFYNLTSNAKGLYGVRVLQLWENYHDGNFSGKVQDQLILVPDATSTLSALLLGLAFIAFVKKRSGARGAY